MGLLSTVPSAAGVASKNRPKTSSDGPRPRQDSSHSKDTMSMMEDELLNQDASEGAAAAAASPWPEKEEDGPAAPPEATAAPADANPLSRRWVPKKKSTSRRRFGSFTTRARANSNASEDDDPSTTGGTRRRVPSFARRLSRRSSLLSSADADEVVLEASHHHVSPTSPSNQVKEHPRPIRRPSILAADEEGSLDGLFSSEATDANIQALDSVAMLASIGRNPTSHQLANIAALRAHEYINEYLFSDDPEHGGILDREEWEGMPQYAKSELTIRKHLGKGSFSDAFEVTVMIDDPNATKRLDSSDKEGLDQLIEARFQTSASKEDTLDREVDAMFDCPSTAVNAITIDGECSDEACVANNRKDLPSPGRLQRGRRQTIDYGVRPTPDRRASFCIRKSATHTNTVPKVQATYAMKCLRPQIRSNAEQFMMGVEDLVHETAMLASLSHKNIIKTHGRARCGSDSLCLSDGFFILLDRLQGTLDDRIDRWKNAASGKRQQPLVSQLKVARSVADALAYLHSRDIVFRDLKPQNVGFDSSGTLKLFDFGFATKMKGRLDEICGTRRYMAPEVGLGRGYGMPADVHSFGILLWEVCALVRPFAKIKSVEEFDLVVFEKGARPLLRKHWDHLLRDVMAGCWKSFPGRRPKMDVVKTMLEVIIQDMPSQQHRRRGSNGDPSRRSLMFRRRVSQ